MATLEIAPPGFFTPFTCERCGKKQRPLGNGIVPGLVVTKDDTVLCTTCSANMSVTEPLVIS